MGTTEMSAPDSAAEHRRDLAVKRLRAKTIFKTHLLLYLAVNTMLTMIWVFSNGGGMFWPIFPIVGWGIALVIHGYVAYQGNIYTEEKIQQEMKKLP